MGLGRMFSTLSPLHGPPRGHGMTHPMPAPHPTVAYPFLRCFACSILSDLISIFEHYPRYGGILKIIRCRPGTGAITQILVQLNLCIHALPRTPAQDFDPIMSKTVLAALKRFVGGDPSSDGCQLLNSERTSSTVLAGSCRCG